MLVAVVGAGCSGGGSHPVTPSPPDLEVGAIHGPRVTDESTSVEYSVTANGPTGIQYSWAVEPPEGGSFSSLASPTTTFTAGDFEEETQVEIRVVVFADDYDPVIRKANLLIKMEPVLITIPPEASAMAEPLVQKPGELIHFFDNGSFDPDGGEIIKYEWDWDGDGIYDEEGPEVHHSWDAIGTYTAGFRVTDDDDETDAIELEVQVDEGWAVSWGCTSGAGDWVRGVDVDIDDSANLYVVGDFTGTVDFDPGPGVEERSTSSEYNLDNYLSIFDSTGEFQSCRDWDSTGSIVGVAANGQGDVVVCGDYYGPVDFDPGPAQVFGGWTGCYLTMFDSMGVYQWSFWLEGYYHSGGWPVETDYDYWFARGVDIDETGNAYFAVARTSEFYQDGGHGGIEISSGSSYGYIYGISRVGEEIGHSYWGGGYYSYEGWYESNTPRGWSADATVSDSGLHCFLGEYADRARVAIGSDFDDDEWLMDVSWISGDGEFTVGSVTFDSEDNFYVGGSFTETMDFDPDGNGYFRSSDGDYDCFLCRFGPSSLEWTVTWGGAAEDAVSDIVTDPNDNIYVLGEFRGTPDFDTGNGINNVTSGGESDVYILRIDPEGNSDWVRTVSGLGEIHAGGITCDKSGRLYVTGSFSGQADLDPSEGEQYASAQGDLETFLIKLLPGGNF